MDVVTVAGIIVGIVAGIVATVEGGIQLAKHLKRRNRAATASSSEERRPQPDPQATKAGTEPRKRHNLPALLTSLIGRTREIADIETCLKDEQVRLLTLTGPGGIGKTRLALQIAWDFVSSFEDGVYFVSLASLADDSLVAASIARALGLKVTGGLSIVDALVEYLRDRHLLLVLDNFEHVIGAWMQVVELLNQCPQLRVLATSREALRVQGEREILLPPLTMPDHPFVPTPGDLQKYEAMALFVERAQAVQPSFAVTADNAQSIAEICRRLDGLPLAIELAAARIRWMSPSVISAQLQQRFLLLESTARDAPRRQKSLEATVAWSYNLLNKLEQALFAQLSVFVGGFTSEAAQSVVRVSASVEEISRGIASLVDKSLMQCTEQVDGASRFSMLETIREYGYRYLKGGGNFETIMNNHVQFYLTLAEQAQSHLEGEQLMPNLEGQQLTWLNRLDQEHGNLRLALDWLVACGQAEASLRLGGTLGLFWAVKGYWVEGRVWLEKVVATSLSADRLARAKPLQVLAYILVGVGEHTQAQRLYEESLALWKEAGDTQGVAWTLHYLSRLYASTGDFERSKEMAEEAQRLFKELGNQSGVAESLFALGLVFLYQGKTREALVFFEDSRQRFTRLSDKGGIALSADGIGDVCRYEGDYGRARSRYLESLSIYHTMGNRWREAVVLASLGEIALAEGDNRDAEAYCNSSLALFRDLGDRRGIGRACLLLEGVAFAEEHYQRAEEYCLKSLGDMSACGDKRYVARCAIELGRVRAAQGRVEEGCRLLAIGNGVLTRLGSIQTANDRQNFERCRDLVRSRVSAVKFQAIWDQGQQMSLEKALELDWALI